MAAGWEKRRERGLTADRYRVSFWDVAVSGDGCATPGALQASEACT